MSKLTLGGLKYWNSIFKVPEVPKKVPEKKVPEKKVPEKKIPEKKVPVPQKEAVPPAKGIFGKFFAPLVFHGSLLLGIFSYTLNWHLFHLIIQKISLLKSMLFQGELFLKKKYQLPTSKRK